MSQATRYIKTLLGEDTTARMVEHLDTTCGLWYRRSPAYRESLRTLTSYRDKHAGQRCVIIGNGPSLRRMDLAPLETEMTFGLNRIYLLFDTLGFHTTYYVSINKYVIEQCAEDIGQLTGPKFISWKARRLIPATPDVIFLRSRRSPRFCTDLPREGIWEGATVTYVALQLAYYMGFRQVILIGVDHAFQTTGKPHELVVSQGHDPNHFHPGYFGKGFRWQLPDLDTSEIAYRMAKDAFERAGREIVDATVGGKLQVFRKVDYQTLF
jgi:hypothetical protein